MKQLITLKFLLLGILVNSLAQYTHSDFWLSNEAQQLSVTFKENKGQIVDTRGNLRPDILFKTSQQGLDIYLRKQGISYVFKKMEESQEDMREKMNFLEQDKDLLEYQLHIQAI